MIVSEDLIFERDVVVQRPSTLACQADCFEGRAIIYYVCQTDEGIVREAGSIWNRSSPMRESERVSERMCSRSDGKIELPCQVSSLVVGIQAFYCTIHRKSRLTDLDIQSKV